VLRVSEAGPGASVERARPGDAPALARVAAASLPAPWSELAFAEEIAAAGARVWLVRGPAGEPVGYLAARRVLDEVEVVSLAVSAEWRRQGLGRALLEHALARENGVTAAHLEVRSDDAGAQAFYAQQGFHAVGRRTGFYPGGTDAVLMTRSLRRPAWTPHPRGRR
jgi:[ribosomal protein S18]-alanine N-acetyltransferase